MNPSDQIITESRISSNLYQFLKIR